MIQKMVVSQEMLIQIIMETAVTVVMGVLDISEELPMEMEIPFIIIMMEL